MPRRSTSTCRSFDDDESEPPRSAKKCEASDVDHHDLDNWTRRSSMASSLVVVVCCGEVELREREADDLDHHHHGESISIHPMPRLLPLLLVVAMLVVLESCPCPCPCPRPPPPPPLLLLPPRCLPAPDLILVSTMRMIFVGPCATTETRRGSSPSPIFSVGCSQIRSRLNAPSTIGSCG